MFLNNIGWGLLGLYLDQILGSQYGVSKPLCFCLQKSKKAIVNADENAYLQDDPNYVEDPNKFEPVSDALKQKEKDRELLIVKNLVKNFGPKCAVNDVNLKMYNG